MSHMTHEQWKITFHFSQVKFIKLTKVMQKWGNLVDKQQSWREFQSNPSRYFPIHTNMGGASWRLCSSWAEGWMWIHRSTQGALLQTSGTRGSGFALSPAATSPSPCPAISTGPVGVLIQPQCAGTEEGAKHLTSPCFPVSLCPDSSVKWWTSCSNLCVQSSHLYWWLP